MGLFSAICVCVGLIVASSCLLSLGQGVGLGGQWFVLAICIVAVLNICVALSFAELHDLMPNIEGGLGQYTQVALGPVVSIISNTSAYVFVALLAAPIEMAMCGMILHELFLPGIPAALIGVIFALLLGIVNYFGVDIFSKVQNLVVGALLFSLAALGFISFFKLGLGTVVVQTMPPLAGSGFGTALALTALAFWLFIGVEYVIPVAKDIKNPKVTVPLAMVLGIILLCVIQAVLGSGMSNYVAYADLVNSELPHMVFAENLLGKAGLFWMGIITFLASISTANTLLGSIPNILSGMAKNDMMPEIFSKKNKYNIPVAGLVLITAFLVFMVGSGLTQSAGLVNGLLVASCFWLTSYILVSLAVLVLRVRYPHHPGRNKKLVFFGLPQIACLLGNIYMIWHISDDSDARMLIYKIFFILLAILVIYALVWTGLVKKKPLFAGADIEGVLSNE
ncbi:amino acid transporter [Candidatus Termititenax persephonae]|uniref:Amino acid transporter n=1 Tax=Candidatus Termititenax persephonae TaxID=2218525 RepID=A0A388TGB3_9BACT|nr:amino acid transporter [Candidatus Termititenax persephonae]